MEFDIWWRVCWGRISKLSGSGPDEACGCSPLAEWTAKTAIWAIFQETERRRERNTGQKKTVICSLWVKFLLDIPPALCCRSWSAAQRNVANSSLHLASEAARCNNGRQQSHSQSDSSRDKASDLLVFVLLALAVFSFFLFKCNTSLQSNCDLNHLCKEIGPPSSAGSADLKANNHLLLDQELAPGVI